MPVRPLLVVLFLLPVALQGQLFGKKNAGASVPYDAVSRSVAYLAPYRREVAEDFKNLAERGKPYYLLLQYTQQILAITDSQNQTTLAPDQMLLLLSLGKQSSQDYGITLLKIEEEAERKLLHIYYTLGEVPADTNEPCVWLLLKKSSFRLQFWQVPWQRRTKKGNSETVYDYKHADGIVYTEYHPLAIDVEASGKPDGGK